MIASASASGESVPIASAPIWWNWRKRPGLRALVAEEGPGVEELHRLRELLHAVLEVGAADRRRPLRPQGDAAPALVLEGEHLLADDVGRAADAALEELGVLEGRASRSARSRPGRRSPPRSPRPARARGRRRRAARRRSRGVPGTCSPRARPYRRSPRPSGPARRGTGSSRARRRASSVPMCPG